jgi:RecA-family ATPase
MKGNGISYNAAPLTLTEWLDRDLPEPDRLLGDWLTTTTPAMFVAPTGLGKTILGLGLFLALGRGEGFLHWKAGRECRVLYVDGEMSRRLMKRRLKDAVRRVGGVRPDGLIVLSKEDFEDMPPLNTPQGQRWTDDFIEMDGPST